MKLIKKCIFGISAALIAATSYAAGLVRPEVSIIAPEQWHTGESVIAVVDVQANDFGHTKFGYYWTDFKQIAPFVKAAYRNLNGRWENITAYMVNNDGVVHPSFWCVDGVHTVRLDLQYNPDYPKENHFSLNMSVNPGEGVTGWQQYKFSKPVVIFNEPPKAQ